MKFSTERRLIFRTIFFFLLVAERNGPPLRPKPLTQKLKRQSQRLLKSMLHLTLIFSQLYHVLAKYFLE
jgi:hypothetical protein